MISARIVGTMAVQVGRQSKQVLPMPTAPFLYKEIMRKVLLIASSTKAFIAIWNKLNEVTGITLGTI